MTSTAYCLNSDRAGKLAESWAEAVGWHVTRTIYGPQPDPAGVRDVETNDFDNRQQMTLADMIGGSCGSNSPWYTPVFIDLMDNYNQSVEQNNPNLPNENASGYTMAELESYLVVKPRDWFGYRDHLVNTSNNTPQNNNAASFLFHQYR